MSATVVFAAQVRQISPLTAIAIVAAVAVLVVVLILVARKIERNRTEALRQASVGVGLDFEERGDIEQIRALGDLPIFGRGRGKKVKNLMSGRNAAGDVRVFDYAFTTGGGKSSHTWTQTIALYPGGGRGLPDFVLSPENPIFHKMGQLLGWQDIDFESNPAFSSSYILKGGDETAIRAAFAAGTLEFFEQHEGWSVEVQGGNLGIYRSEKRVKPEQMGTFLDETATVLAALARR